MSKKTLRTVLIVLICALTLILAGLAGLILYKYMGQGNEPTVPTTTAPPVTTQAPTQATTQPTTQPVVETTVQTEPQPVSYILTFAGDCTLGNQKGASDTSGFIGTVGKDYAYPFADVMDYFGTDDCTFINLEGTFTDAYYAEDKMFCFKGPKDYINILLEGSVEFANVANNHSYDYGKQGYEDTVQLLEENGIAYAHSKDTALFEIGDGLKIGVYSVAGAYKTDGVAENIKALRKAGADVVIACMHWGEEYYYVPNQDQVIIARTAIDAGADIVYGHHPHVLQKIEQYKDGIIFYSLGNFSFGGNNSPADKDTAILQQEIIRHPDGTVEMGELTIIPCYVSGILTYGNDYQPMPIPETDEAYARVLRKLSGQHDVTHLYVPYRDDLNNASTSTGGTGTGSTDTAGATAGTTVPAGTTTPPVQTTPPTQAPAPAETTPATQAPAPAETTPATQAPAPAETTPATQTPPPAETTPQASGDAT